MQLIILFWWILVVALEFTDVVLGFKKNLWDGPRYQNGWHRASNKPYMQINCLLSVNRYSNAQLQLQLEQYEVTSSYLKPKTCSLLLKRKSCMDDEILAITDEQ